MSRSLSDCGSADDEDFALDPDPQEDHTGGTLRPSQVHQAEADEEEVPSGAVFVVAPPTWDQLQARFDVRLGPQPQTVTVD